MGDTCKIDDGKDNQSNCTIEDELPEGTSKKGVNQKDLYITCDNCPGQNKTIVTLALVMVGYLYKFYDTWAYKIYL